MAFHLEMLSLIHRGTNQVRRNAKIVEMCPMQISLATRLPPDDMIKTSKQVKITVLPLTLNISKLHCFSPFISTMYHKHPQSISFDPVQY
jgi:hypothetical protein